MNDHDSIIFSNNNLITNLIELTFNMIKKHLNHNNFQQICQKI